MNTVYCTTPPKVRLNQSQLAEICNMEDEQFRQFVKSLDDMRCTALTWKYRKEKVDALYHDDAAELRMRRWA